MKLKFIKKKTFSKISPIILAVIMVISSLSLCGIFAKGSDVTTWNFGSASVSLNYQGNKGTYNGIEIDATTGKLNNAGRTDEWCQFNTGTKLSVPVTGASKITVKTFSVGVTVNGQQSTTPTQTFDYTGAAGYVDIISAKASYISYITVESVATATVPQTTAPAASP